MLLGHQVLVVARYVDLDHLSEAARGEGFEEDGEAFGDLGGWSRICLCWHLILLTDDARCR